MAIAKGSALGTCSVCGKEAWSPRSNKCADHRNSKTKGAARIPGPGREESTAARVVGGLPSIDAKTFSGRPPTASEWEEKLSALVVLGTMMFVEFAVIKPAGLQEPYATQMTEELGMTDAEAEKIVEPFAHLFAGLEVNKSHGRHAIEFLAFAPAMLSAADWYQRIAHFRREDARAREMGGAVVMPPPREREPDSGSSGRAQAQAPADGGTGPVVANFGGAGVWDPDQAPTARIHPDGAELDDPDRAIEAAHSAFNGAAGDEDGWSRAG